MSILLDKEKTFRNDTNGGSQESSFAKSSRAEPAWTTDPLVLPRLNTRSAYAAGAKAAARLNATTATAKEEEDLLSERQRLLDRLFSGEITTEEKNRLDYVRWSLDRIEDARHGATLDALEIQADAYESFVVEVNKFYEQLNSRVQRPKR
ncbi:hypothetical protein [Rhizobium sp. Root482]|uniref:hypothetical protein n=1 Tax=Rhizobium sp. Root482 TaxID=1736543 RepID=UPI0012E3E2C1|nr:hypothetical protein [Rhizobium sp. Root482]